MSGADGGGCNSVFFNLQYRVNHSVPAVDGVWMTSTKQGFGLSITDGSKQETDER